jgi:hypothetical protein
MAHGAGDRIPTCCTALNLSQHRYAATFSIIENSVTVDKSMKWTRGNTFSSPYRDDRKVKNINI